MSSDEFIPHWLHGLPVQVFIPMSIGISTQRHCVNIKEHPPLLQFGIGVNFGSPWQVTVAGCSLIKGDKEMGTLTLIGT